MGITGGSGGIILRDPVRAAAHGDNLRDPGMIVGADAIGSCPLHGQRDRLVLRDLARSAPVGLPAGIPVDCQRQFGRAALAGAATGS